MFHDMTRKQRRVRGRACEHFLTRFLSEVSVEALVLVLVVVLVLEGFRSGASHHCRGALNPKPYSPRRLLNMLGFDNSSRGRGRVRKPTPLPPVFKAR